MRHISIGLTSVAIILWLHAVLWTQLKLGPLGLFDSLPLSFYVAIGLLSIASGLLWHSPRNESRLLFPQLCFLLVMIYLTPVLLGLSPGLYSTPLSNLGPLEYLLEQGYTDVAIDVRFNWPSLYILSAIIEMVSGGNLVKASLAYVPLLVAIGLQLPLHMFLKTVLGKDRENYVWAVEWLFYLGLPIGFAGYFYAQTLAFVLWLFLLASMTHQRVYPLVSILIVSSLPMYHLLTSVAALPLCVMLGKSRKMSSLAQLAIVFILMWTLFCSSVWITNNLPDFLDRIVQYDPWMSGTLGRVGTGAHAQITWIRSLLYASFIVIGFVGLVLGLKSRRTSPFHPTAILLIGGLIILGILLFPVYGFEMLGRLLFLTLPLISYFASRFLYFKAASMILLIFLLFALPLSFVAVHGDAAANHTSVAYLAGLRFFHDNTSSGEIDTFNREEWGRMKSIQSYVTVNLDPMGTIPLRSPSGERIVSYFLDAGGLSPLRYFVVSRVDEARIQFLYNETTLITSIRRSIENSTKANLSYTNKDLNIYMREP